MPKPKFLTRAKLLGLYLADAERAEIAEGAKAEGLAANAWVLKRLNLESTKRIEETRAAARAKQAEAKKKAEAEIAAAAAASPPRRRRRKGEPAAA